MRNFNKSIMAASVCAALTLGACSAQRFTISGGAGQIAKDDMSNFFVYGIGQTNEINAAQICGRASKIVSVEAEQTFLNGLLGALTYGIYAPRQYRVTCKS